MTKDELNELELEQKNIILQTPGYPLITRPVVEAQRVLELIADHRKLLKQSEDVLEVMNRYGQIDGAHHKLWVIDQSVRILTGCPMVPNSAIDSRGKRYEFESLGESPEYLEFVREYEAPDEGDDPDDGYEWDTGIAP